MGWKVENKQTKPKSSQGIGVDPGGVFHPHPTFPNFCGFFPFFLSPPPGLDPAPEQPRPPRELPQAAPTVRDPLGIHWGQIGNPLGIHWESIGNPLGTNWEFTGIHWEYFEDKLGIHRNPLGILWGILWGICWGFQWGSIGESFEDPFGIHWECIGGSTGNPLEIHKGIQWESIGNPLGTYWNPLEIHLG